MQETQVGPLSREDLLEKEIATHSSILAWDRGAWQATVHVQTAFVPHSQPAFLIGHGLAPAAFLG